MQEQNKAQPSETQANLEGFFKKKLQETKKMQ